MNRNVSDKPPAGAKKKNDGTVKPNKADNESLEHTLIQVISDPTRIGIMKTLSENRSLCGKDILTYFSITQPTLSHHLNLLCSCGLVDSAREGKYVRYRLNRDGVLKLVKFFEELILEKPEESEPRKLSEKTSAPKLSLKKSPMLPTPKSVIPSPEIPEETIIENKKIKKKEAKKDKKKKKKN
ncbi:MAG: helix-turn-helix transcriptional regulator [Clostridiales bacterium]|nr:helix-turn-helix transcriptional regulator [Clostridiales bacterium]